MVAYHLELPTGETMLHRHYIVLAMALGICLSWTASSSAQPIVIYNSNGFEPPTFTAVGNPPLGGYNPAFVPGGQAAESQDLWSTSDDNQILYPIINNPAGFLQTSITQGGSGQALRAQGDRLLAAEGLGGGTFWWRYPDFAGNVFNPVANSRPIVVASTGIRRESAGFGTDIPLSGMYFEGFRSITGVQRQITQVALDITGGITVTSLNAFPNSSLSSAPNLVAVDTWVDLRAELNFATQTFRVYLNNVAIGFGPGQTLFNVPFRNTDQTTGGPFDRLREYGYVAYFNFLSGGSTGNSYFDNFELSAVVGVPEPTTYALILGMAAFAGMWTYRKHLKSQAAEMEVVPLEV